MITEKQKNYIIDLYTELNMEIEEDLDDLTIGEASALIDELKELMKEL